MNMRRRKFLQATGLGAGSLLLPSLFDRRGASAGPVPGAVPRIVFCFAEHGVVRENWAMLRGNPDAGRWDYDLSAVPDAEFSTLAMTKSMLLSSTSAGIARRAISRPGLPKMSPIKRICM